MVLNMLSRKASDTWVTPQQIFDYWDEIYDFQIDAAANESNHKCQRWFGPGGEIEDALVDDWPVFDGTIWCNPPYSRGFQHKFVDKAINCALRGGTVLMMLPADTSTKLFHEKIDGHFFYHFWKGRVRFVGAPGPAKFGSMFVVFEQQ